MGNLRFGIKEFQILGGVLNSGVDGSMHRQVHSVYMSIITVRNTAVPVNLSIVRRILVVPKFRYLVVVYLKVFIHVSLSTEMHSVQVDLVVPS